MSLKDKVRRLESDLREAQEIITRQAEQIEAAHKQQETNVPYIAHLERELGKTVALFSYQKTKISWKEKIKKALAIILFG